MDNLFPPGFWSTLSLLGMIIFFIFGVDLLLGAKMITAINKALDRKFHVDRAIANALEELKRRSDKEFDVDRSLMHGWGRFVVSGLLIFGAALILLNVMPLFR